MRIAKKSTNFSDWYTDVILAAELADYAPVKGCMVIRPYGYALWEAIQAYMDRRIKDHGVANAYFPIFIPEHFINKEKDHVKGFAPQLAVVTFAGGEELKEKLVVRPTSETVMYEMYKKWTQSYRDLPILINQWNNVVRWEKRTYLFLRTSEFLWQEGHCAHATHEESTDIVMWALRMYVDTYRNLLGMYGVAGIKSESEKFAGACRTYTYEMLMPDGKVLQGCTSHDLGQNFAKAFDWTVLGKDGGRLFPWQNSWGFSTRSIGGLVMAHGDDQGLVLPPEVAPTQIVIIPIPGSKKALEYARSVYRVIAGVKKASRGSGIKLDDFRPAFRVVLDDIEGETAGFKFNKWELRGVPLRIEVGDQEAEGGTVTVVRRDTGGKFRGTRGELLPSIPNLLDLVQASLLSRHKYVTEANTRPAETYEEFKRIMVSVRGFISAFWCENPECEAKIKEETKASTRCLPINLETGKPEEKEGKCVYCGGKSKHRWLFAQAY